MRFDYVVLRQMLTFDRTANPRKQGDAGMGIAIGWFACNGYTVCVPLTDSQGYDLVVDGSNGLQRVGVRSTTRVRSGGGYEVGLRTQGGNKSQFKISHFDPTVLDLLFVACADGSAYLIPASEVYAKSALTVSPNKWAHRRVIECAGKM